MLTVGVLPQPTLIVPLLRLLQKIYTMHHVHTTYRLNLRNESIPGTLYVLGGFVTGTLNVFQATAGPSHTQATGPYHHHATAGTFHTQATAGPFHTEATAGPSDFHLNLSFYWICFNHTDNMVNYEVMDSEILC